MARKMRQSGVDWIGEIPEGWEVKRFKHVVTSLRKGNGITKEDVFADGDLPCIRYGEIYSRYGFTVDRCASKTRRCLLPDPVFAVSGDILFACTGELVEEIGKNVLYSGNQPCAAGGDILVASHDQHPAFLNYYLNCHSSQFQKSRNKAKLKVVHIKTSDIANLVVLLPPLCEQRRLAAFLDLKCSEIDRSVSDAKKCIEDYKKLKSSLIEEVATKGVSHSKTRPVDADWIHAVPSEWEFKQIRYLLQLRNERNEKPLSEVNLISLYTDKGVVQHCDLEKTTGNKAATADGYKLVYEDDIVVNIILCWMGAIGRSAYNGVTSPAYDVYRVKNKNEVCPRYYHYLFRTMAFSGACYRRGRGIMMMRWRTYSDQFRSIKVPVPPLNEQTSIADYLDEKCGEIDAIIADKERLIADLETYKKSLIVEVVTGKREVA